LRSFTAIGAPTSAARQSASVRTASPLLFNAASLSFARTVAFFNRGDAYEHKCDYDLATKKSGATSKNVFL
jgi:hypothetical protein